MTTNTLKAKDIHREWHLLDAKEQILGRLATQAATILSGKTKPSFVPYLDNGDYVVVVNAATVKVTGNKELKKKYIRHSGYPGGLKQQTLEQLRSDQPEKIILHAVKGMLPKTKLGRVMIKKLHVFSGNEHPFSKQIKGEK